MFNVKRVVSVLVILVISAMVSCTKMEEDKDAVLDLFDVLKGREVAKEYLINISNGNIEKANELCDTELIKNNVNFAQGISNITGFQLDESISGSNFAYFIFNVIRDSSAEPKSDLENYTIKIKRDGNKYTVGDIKAKSEKELYVRNNAIRIIGENGGKSSLVINLNNIPKDTYLRSNEIMVYKEKVPNNNFGKIILGFTGKKVAVSTVDDQNSYICIVYIDDSLIEEGGSEIPQGTPIEGEILGNLQESVEKPVSRKVVSVDLINNGKIEDFIFSKEDDNLAVNYKDKDGGDRVNIYKTEDGEKIKTKFEEIFSKEIYNLKADYFEESKLIFNVYKKDNSSDDITGKYSLNLKSEEMIKL